MTKTLTALTAAAALAASMTFAPGDAYAGGRGGAVAAGIIGGIAAGAIIGGALASRPAYGGPVYAAPPPPPPAYGGGYAPAYAGPPVPVGCPGGYWARRPLYGPYGEFIGYSRPRFICP